ncbi:IS6 family transposase [Vibrio parahaemolyticus]|nr:IS6 family transposase [Vibrio parahaemolyticus]
MTDFKGRHFSGQIIHGMSYRELAEMLEEHGVSVDHSTIYRWVQK